MPFGTLFNLRLIATNLIRIKIKFCINKLWVHIPDEVASFLLLVPRTCGMKHSCLIALILSIKTDQDNADQNWVTCYEEVSLKNAMPFSKQSLHQAAKIKRLESLIIEER